MNTLSTPTARTRKGITSAMINVTLTFKREKSPTEEHTDRMTREIPNKPSVTLDWVKRLLGKRGSSRGTDPESTDKLDEATLRLLKRRGKLRAHVASAEPTVSSSHAEVLPNVNETYKNM